MENRKNKAAKAFQQNALKRIYASGLTLSEAVNMSDNKLLSYPAIGRKTLAYIKLTASGLY